jgi:hypothetical protein
MSVEHLRREIASAFQVVRDRSTDEEICIICPVPGCADKSGNRYINVKTRLTHCYRCEGKSPGHVKGLFRLMGVDFDDDEQVLEPEQLLDMLKGTGKKALTPVQNIDLPEGFRQLKDNQGSCYWKFCKKMAERKHLEIEDLEEAGAGFTRVGDWEPFCIFPVYEGDRTVYYQGRTYLDDNTETTKKFPNRKVVPYGARYWVYNLDALAKSSLRLAVVVESVLNLLSLKKKIREIGESNLVVPVCVFTHALSLSQVAKMRRYSHIQEWCFLFDSDSTNLAEIAANSLSSVLPVTVAEMPHGKSPDGTTRKTNDPNDDVEAAIKAIEKRHQPNPSEPAAVVWSKLRKETRQTAYSLNPESS